MFLIDSTLAIPRPRALIALEAANSPHFTTELGLFQLELNLDPQRLGGRCLRQMEEQLGERLTHLEKALSTARRGLRAHRHPAHAAQVRSRARQHGAEPALPSAQPGDDRAARRRLRDRDQGRRRAAHQARLGHGRGVQLELPGAPADGRQGVRAALQPGPGAGGPARSPPPRTRRCCSAGGCGPRRASRCSSRRSTRAARNTSAT